MKIKCRLEGCDNIVEDITKLKKFCCDRHRQLHYRANLKKKLDALPPEERKDYWRIHREKKEKKYSPGSKYCNTEFPKEVPAVCPRCGVKYLAYFMFGYSGDLKSTVRKYCPACKVQAERYFEINGDAPLQETV